MGTQSPVFKAIIVVFAVIGFFTVIAIAGMALMHNRMGDMMGSETMRQGKALAREV